MKIIDGWTVIEYDLRDLPEKPLPYAVDMVKGDSKVMAYGTSIEDAIHNCQQKIYQTNHIGGA